MKIQFLLSANELQSMYCAQKLRTVESYASPVLNPVPFHIFLPESLIIKLR